MHFMLSVHVCWQLCYCHWFQVWKHGLTKFQDPGSDSRTTVLDLFTWWWPQVQGRGPWRSPPAHGRPTASRCPEGNTGKRAHLWRPDVGTPFTTRPSHRLSTSWTGSTSPTVCVPVGGSRIVYRAAGRGPTPVWSLQTIAAVPRLSTQC